MIRKIKTNKTAFAIYAIIALIVSIIGAVIPASALPSTTTLTLTADSYTITKTADEILTMPSVTGIGATIKSGTVSNLGTYTGVSMIYLCEQVGTLSSSSTVHVIATDGYTQDYTYDEVYNNALATFNVTTGVAIPNEGTTMIVAYSYNGGELTSSQGGPLRVLLVSDDGVAMTAKISAKYVASITIINPLFVAPEYPLGGLIALTACFAAVAVYAAFKTGISIPHFSMRIKERYLEQ